MGGVPRTAQSGRRPRRRTPRGEERPDYYENCLAALQRLLVESRILTPEEIEERVRQFVREEPKWFFRIWCG